MRRPVYMHTHMSRCVYVYTRTCVCVRVTPTRIKNVSRPTKHRRPGERPPRESTVGSVRTSRELKKKKKRTSTTRLTGTYPRCFRGVFGFGRGTGGVSSLPFVCHFDIKQFFLRSYLFFHPLSREA